MRELVYAGGDVAKIIKEKYPSAVIEDASDYIHTERFEVEISDITDDDFYPFAIREGFAECCFSFNLLLMSLKFPESKTIKPKDNEAKIRKWLEMAKLVK
jgi:hypothetical protein